MLLKLKNIKQLLFVLFVSTTIFSSCEKDLDFETNNNQPDNIKGSGGTISFEQSGPVGGGFPNVVSWDPNIPGKIYYGSDIGGTGRSTDYGRNFESAAKGLGSQSHKKIAALNAVDVDGTTVIVGGTGFKGKNGEVISSNDGGDNWKVDSEQISFSAQNSDDPLPKTRPRSTDPSLIQRVSGSTWVAGTYDKGVWISTNNRASWKPLNVFDGGGAFIRAMAMSPDDSNTVYVGLWGGNDNTKIKYKGLWRISNLDGVPRGEKVPGIPDVVESIVVLGKRMYLACGRFGVRRYVPSNGNLSDITGPIGTSVMATAIHGVRRTWNTDRIVVGTAEGNGDIWVSENSGSNFTNTTESGVSINPYGSDEDLIVFKTHGNWALGGSKCDVAAIQVSPHNPDAWAVCSTSAIWTTVDAGKTWQPANGFQILSYRDVEINESGVIAAGNVDHDVLISNDGGSKWTSKGLGGVSVVHGLTFSPDGTELAFANNERDNNTTAGKLGVISSPDRPVAASLNEIMNLSSPKRIVGLEWIVFPGGTERLIMAVDDGGIQTVDRSDGSWSNQKVRTTKFMNSQGNNGLRSSIVSNGTSTTFVYDRKSGVWRSTNYGVDWTRISDEVAAEDAGYLAYDSDEDILYISTQNQVLRMDNASNSERTTNLGFPSSKPGAMALDPYGRLIVFGRSSSNSDGVLYRIADPTTNENAWVDIADDNFKRVSPPVTDMDASKDYIVLVTAGKGMLVGENDRP